MWLGAPLLTVFLLTSACGAFTFGRVSVNEPIRPADVAFIERGRTSLIEVVDRLGAPGEITPFQQGALGTYYFLDAKVSRANFGWFGRFWLPVSPDLVFSRAGLGMDRFEVRFDSDWTVRDYNFASYPETAGHLPQPF